MITWGRVGFELSSPNFDDFLRYNHKSPNLLGATRRDLFVTRTQHYSTIAALTRWRHGHHCWHTAVFLSTIRLLFWLVLMLKSWRFCYREKTLCNTERR